MSPRPGHTPFARRVPRSVVLPILSILAVASCKDAGIDCLGPLGISIQAAQVFEQDEFQAMATWPGGGAGCPTTFTWQATLPLSIVGSTTAASVTVRATAEGQGSLSLRAGGNEFTASRDVPVLRSTGELDVVISGLETGIDADVRLNGPNGFTRAITETTQLSGLVAGAYQWTASNVHSAMLHRWSPNATTGTFDLQRNDHANLSFIYRRETGQVDFDAVDVPDGNTGLFARITNDDGFTVDIEVPRISLVIEPGMYRWDAFETDPLRFQFTPDAFTGTFLVGAGANIPLNVPFTGQRGFLVLEAPGLPPNVTVESTISTSVSTTPVSLPGADYYKAATYALDVPDLIDLANTISDQVETYRPQPPTQLINLLGGQVLMMDVPMHLSSWYATYNATMLVSSDPFNFTPTIGFPQSLDIRVTVTSPPPSGANLAATGEVGEMIAISGPTPWVQVTGALSSDSTFTATAMATVASYPNVPVTLTGKLDSGGVVSGTLQMGSDTVPKGLPSGAVRYTVSGLRVSLTRPPPAR